MRYFLFCLALLFSTNSYAQTSEQQLTITKAGYFLTVVDEDAVPRYVKLTNIVDLTSPTDPKPDPPTDPNPPTLDMGLVKDVQKWASEPADPRSSQAIAAVYSTVRKAGLEFPWPVLKEATDEAISIVESKSNWDSFRKNLSAVISERSQRGTLDNNVVLLSIQQGLEMSADGSIALPIDTINKVIETTKGIINES
jgi:hypothetical protein